MKVHELKSILSRCNEMSEVVIANMDNPDCFELFTYGKSIGDVVLVKDMVGNKGNYVKLFPGNSPSEDIMKRFIAEQEGKA